MKIGFVVNRVATEKAEYTTTRLALAASRRGHHTWLMGVDDFSHRPDGSVAAHAYAARGKNHKTPAAYLESVQADDRWVEGVYPARRKLDYECSH